MVTIVQLASGLYMVSVDVRMADVHLNYQWTFRAVDEEPTAEDLQDPVLRMVLKVDETM